MKVYVFYLTLPEDINELRSIYHEEEVDYFMEIKSMLFKVPMIFDEESGETYYRYAFTNNKDYADIYEETHNMKLFKRSERKMTKKEYESFRKDNLDQEIILRDIDGFDALYFDDRERDKEPILIVRHEMYEISDTLDMILRRDLSTNSIYPYTIFKEKYIEGLDKLFYCNNFMMELDTDYTSYQESYYATVEGYGRNIRLKPNILAMYMRVFGLLLNKGR